MTSALCLNLMRSFLNLPVPRHFHYKCLQRRSAITGGFLISLIPPLGYFQATGNKSGKTFLKMKS